MAGEKASDPSKKRRRGRKGGSDGGGATTESATSYQAHKTPLVQLDEEAPTWFEYGKNLPGRNDTITTDPPSKTDQSNQSLVAKYRSMGDMIFQKEIQLMGRDQSSDAKWVEKTIKRGTLKDRIAAMSVTVSTDPIHKFHSLEGLLTMAGCSETGGKTNSRVAQLSAEALEDLFLNTFLPPDRKLLTLAQRPLYRYEASKTNKQSKKTLSPRILLLWRFEEMVKEKYDLFLRKCIGFSLQEGAEMLKIAALKSATSLLCAAPEGEALLLNMIVNKLGDPGKKIASAAGHQLRLVLQSHPNMQLVIAREVQQLVHRPHLSPRALYSCIVFLNQLKFSAADKEQEQATNMQLQREPLPVSLTKTYFRLFEVAVKGKDKKLDPQSEEAGMKSRLLSALLTGVNRAHPYLPAKDKAMDEHIDALYRVVHTAAPSACTQALMLLFHLAVGSQLEEGYKPEVGKKEDDTSASKDARKDRFYRALYATLSKPTLVSQGKHLTMYFNLLYKAMKYDTSVNRINAFAKRLMCTAMHGSPTPIAGSVFLLNEIAKHHDGLRICLEMEPTESNGAVFLDETKRDPRAALTTPEQEEQTEKDLCPPSWELSLIAHHFHPSVAKFVSEIGELRYEGDPLKDFGLAPFLDKFAYRNPKSRDKLDGHYKRGQSIAERKSGTEGMLRARLELPVNDPAFLERENVDEQDKFFHKFFVERARRDEIKGISRGSKKEMNEDEQEEAEELALDAAEEADGWDTGKTFEEYERAWETDSEEEAFVDSLVTKLMEDSADGPVDLDDEDPDMDDWGTMYSDNDEEKDAGEDADDDDGDAGKHSDFARYEEEEMDDDEPPEMEESDSDEDDEEADEKPEAADEDDFMDAEDSDDESEESEGLDIDGDIQGGMKGAQEGSDVDEGSDDDDLALVEDDDDESDNDDNTDNEEETPRSRKRAKVLPTFADADEYTEKINESYGALLGTSPPKTNTTAASKGKKGSRKITKAKRA